MAFHIRNQAAEDALRRLCELTGESLTDAVLKSLKMRLEHEARTRGEVPVKREQREEFLWEEYRKMQDRIAKLPVLDNRTADEIIGYDEHGLPA
jgi:antitoxin VapB